jgi:hypothetical protein
MNHHTRQGLIKDTQRMLIAELARAGRKATNNTWLNMLVDKAESEHSDDRAHIITCRTIRQYFHPVSIIGGHMQGVTL